MGGALRRKWHVWGMLFQINAFDFFVFLALLFAVLDIWRFREEMLLLNANQVFNTRTIESRNSLLTVRCFFAFYKRLCILNFNWISAKVLQMSQMDTRSMRDHNLFRVRWNRLHKVCKTGFERWWNILFLFNQVIWLVCWIRGHRNWVCCIGLNRSTTCTVRKSKILLQSLTSLTRSRTS